MLLESLRIEISPAYRSRQDDSGRPGHCGPRRRGSRLRSLKSHQRFEFPQLDKQHDQQHGFLEFKYGEFSFGHFFFLAFDVELLFRKLQHERDTDDRLFEFDL